MNAAPPFGVHSIDSFDSLEELSTHAYQLSFETFHRVLRGSARGSLNNVCVEHRLAYPVVPFLRKEHERLNPIIKTLQNSILVRVLPKRW